LPVDAIGERTVPPKFFKNPTLEEFIAEAISQGGELTLIGGHRRKVLIGSNKVSMPLPLIADTDPLVATTLESLCRGLGITGYEHLYRW
jgi:hypothetical protein